MSASIQFNVIISGVSVSGDLDTASQPLRIDLGNSDKIGYATFALQNSTQGYSTTIISGNAICQIDAVVNGISQTVFRGTIEKIEPTIEINRGSFTLFHVYDYAQELLNVVSPDARQPYLLNTDGTINILSGDGGMGTLNGMELTHYVSGVNVTSGPTLSAFLSQYLGVSGNKTGSWSGTLFGFKPYISGYTWATYYIPDASGGALANDSNLNYWMPFNTFKVRREYAWDMLRKMLRQNPPIDSAGQKASFELYVGVSGDVHVFTSGSYEFLASGINGQVTFQYYAAGSSGANLNNIISLKTPFDTTYVKNYIEGWFPPETVWPPDQDFFSDFFAYSGIQWSGQQLFGAGNSLVLSGNNPAPTGIGTISIWGVQSGGQVGAFGLFLQYTFSGKINVTRWNVSGTGGVSFNYQMRKNTSGAAGGAAETRAIYIIDTSGNWMQKFGSGTFLNLVGTAVNSSGPWQSFSEMIYTLSGTFFSGKGDGFTDNGWNTASGAITGPVDLTRINSFSIGIRSMGTAGVGRIGEIAVDNVFFSFNYPFSPIVAFNSGSQGMLGRRYAVVEYPVQTEPELASGTITHEINSRMGQKGIAELIVRDNFLQPVSYQLAIKPGQVFVIDAPALNTGSGQTFFYWKAIDVQHEWSHSKGFITNIKALPWFSGTVTAPYSNFVDYQRPLLYQGQPPPAQRNLYMPMQYPWQQTGPR